MCAQNVIPPHRKKHRKFLNYSNRHDHAQQNYCKAGGGGFSHLQLVAPGDISILAIWSSESLVQRQEL